MIQKIREWIKRAPLAALILLIWFVLTILSVAGRGRAYKNYSTKHGTLPGLSLVMRGIHDHVMPWSPAPDSTGDAEDADDVSGTGRSGEGTAAAADLPGNGTETGRDGEAADGAGDGSAPSGSAEDTGGQKEGSKEDTDSGTDGGSGSENQEKGQSGNSENESGEKTSSEGTDAAVKEGTAGDRKEDEASSGPSMTIPDSSQNKVVQARDYGTAEEYYLSPEGTKYNTDTEGLFAPNGIYYPLQEVDDNYFADALLIGDSRTVGLYEYGNMHDITSFLARESTNVYDLFKDSEKLDYSPLGKTAKERTLEDLLKETVYRKIYISVGINELGVPDTLAFYKEYRKVIRKIHELQPDAVIYIQGIMHVSEEKSRKDHVFNNTAIVQRNEAIATLANGRNIFYIDMNADLCDKDGNLKADLTGDGIHLKASACELWHTFLKKNAVIVPD